MRELLRLLLSLQSESGAFESTVHFAGGSLPDYNGFATALVLRALEALPGADGWDDARQRALDFLEQCEAPRPGVFAFWPRHSWPIWMPDVRDDADDTAVMASELLHHGRIDLEHARKLATTALIPYRLEQAPELADAAWIRAGAFLTWLDPVSAPNPIDCVVNTNVLAFLAQIGFTDAPGYREGCETVVAGIVWAAREWERIPRLSPYYPEGSELVGHLANAVHRGARDLEAAQEELARFPPLRSDDEPSKVLFSFPNRSARWSSTAVWAARRIAWDSSY